MKQRAASTITDTILMVRPANFGYNTETATNNSFQDSEGAKEVEKIKAAALSEFDQMVVQLRAKGIDVLVMDDGDIPAKPDAIFPNNWFSCHTTGEIISYPMFAENRRIERIPDYMQKLIDAYGFSHRIYLEAYENQSKYLEGTGSMIIDRVHKICYACLSPRTDEEVLDDLCERMSYEKICFDAVDRQGEAIYHTNVMMALGENLAVISLDTIKDIEQKEKVLRALQKTHKKIVDISLEQVEQFAGNMLQVKNKARKPFLVMSQSAFDSLNNEQLESIHQSTETMVIDIPTIERYGGGSVRCMMAEIFIPS